jgi:hypothetical protein
MCEGDEQRRTENERRIINWLTSRFPDCRIGPPVDVEDGAWRSFVVRPSKGRFQLRVWQENLTDDWESPTEIVDALDSRDVAARMRHTGVSYVEFWWDPAGWQCREVGPGEAN